MSGVSIPGTGPVAGMYNKIQMIDDMGNGDSALVIVPTYSNPDLFVVRIPASGI